MLTAAYAVRDRLSGDTWYVVNGLRLRLDRFESRSREALDGLEDDLDALVTDIAAMFALAQESMLRGQDWLFLDTGRRLERALLLVALLRATLVERYEPSLESQLVEAVLGAAESLMAYRRVSYDSPQMEPALALLLLAETHPRSLAFQLDQIQRSVKAIAHEDGRVELTEEERLVLDAATTLHLADLAGLAASDEDGTRSALDALLARLRTLLAQTADVMTRHYFNDVRGPQHLARAVGEVTRG